MSTTPQPVFFVRDIEGNYREADPQPSLPEPEGPLMMQCSRCSGFGRSGGGACPRCGGAGIYADESCAGGQQ